MPTGSPATYCLKDLTTSSGSTSQVNLSASATYGFNYEAGTHFAAFELGGKIRH